MNLTALQERASLNHQVRVFFAERKVLEVETPALSQAGNTDPFIDSFSVNIPAGLRYLHTSPEYPMKRLLVAGLATSTNSAKYGGAMKAASAITPSSPCWNGIGSVSLGDN